MGVLTKVISKLIGRGSRPLSLRDPDHWRNDGADVPSGEVASADSVMKLSAAWACVNLLAGTIASLPLMVYRTNASGARTVAKDHPLYRVLHDSPNSLQTSLDFWEFIAASIELHGNGLARKIKNGDRIVGLVPIMPDLPSVRLLTGNRIEYRWTADGQSFVETDENILHIRGFGGNPLGGMSTLAFGARSFGLSIAIERAAGSTFKNGLRPSGSIETDTVIKATKEQLEEIEAGLHRKYAGAVNAGKPMLLQGGLKWKQLSLNPEDAQMLESRAFGIEDTCRFFGVPPFMVGHTEKTTSWGTGLSEQVLGFQKFTLRRRLKRIEQALEKQLLTPQDRADGIVVEFNLEGLLRGDSSARASFYGSGLKDGWLSVNEVRALENMPPVPGGDVNRVQMQNVPLTEAASNLLPKPQ